MRSLTFHMLLKKVRSYALYETQTRKSFLNHIRSPDELHSTIITNRGMSEKMHLVQQVFYRGYYCGITQRRIQPEHSAVSVAFYFLIREKNFTLNYWEAYMSQCLPNYTQIAYNTCLLYNRFLNSSWIANGSNSTLSFLDKHKKTTSFDSCYTRF